MTRKIGSLWQHKSKDDKTYLAGNLEVIIGQQIKIAVFKNEKKSGNQPDWNIVLSEEKETSEKEEEL